MAESSSEISGVVGSRQSSVRCLSSVSGRGRGRGGCGCGCGCGCVLEGEKKRRGREGGTSRFESGDGRRRLKAFGDGYWVGRAMVGRQKNWESRAGNE